MNIQALTRFSLSTLTVFIFLSSSAPLKASDLELADSLFEAKKYTLALPIYDSIYSKAELQTPQMLLKMAMIHEGLGDAGKAIYL